MSALHSCDFFSYSFVKFNCKYNKSTILSQINQQAYVIVSNQAMCLPKDFQGLGFKSSLPLILSIPEYSVSSFGLAVLLLNV
jgi:hypothetical protein